MGMSGKGGMFWMEAKGKQWEAKHHEVRLDSEEPHKIQILEFLRKGN